MIQPITIVVCGQSLYLQAVAETLQARAGLSVNLMNPAHPDALNRVAALSPDVVIIEPNGHADQLTTSLLDKGYPLLKLDPQQQSVAVISPQQMAATSMVDLVQIINQAVKAQNSFKESS